MKSNTYTTQRIASIDALRGFDMLMIIFLDHFAKALDVGFKTPVSQALARQFDHPEWLGSTVYDIVMPLFLFIVGASIPFSLSQRQQEASGKKAIYFRLARRFVLLFFLGWIVQGRLLEFNPETFAIFSNTLQAIAVGYVLAAIAFIKLKKTHQYILFFACLLAYTLLLLLPEVPGVGRGLLEPSASFAWYVDQVILGDLQDGTQYTWLLSGLGFTATTLSGVFAGETVKSDLPRHKVVRRLLIIGLLLLAGGIIAGNWHPIIKKLWTSTFVLASSGVCLLLLALFYWIIDVKGLARWAFPLRVIGMNALVAYVLSHVFNFHQIADMVLFGFKQYTGDFHYLLLTIGGFGLLYLILWYLWKNKTFIKV